MLNRLLPSASRFASTGLSQFTLGALGVLLLVRYRPLVPVFLLLLLLEFLARKGIDACLPIARSGAAPGGAISWSIFGVILLAFVLSLRQGSPPRPSSDA